MTINSKRQFFAMWEQGLLGNRPNLWRDPEPAWAARSAFYGFREHSAGGGSWEKVPTERFWETYNRWKAAGRVFTMDDACPDGKQLLQGEICRTWRGLEGWLDTSSKLHMRPAAAAGFMRPCLGATVLALTQKFMDPSSQDDLWMLLDLYPDATVEFTTFSVNVGVYPHRNTIFWETRNY
jgi:hypothetical protein